MDLSHRFTVPTGVAETWSHFQDLGALAECFPGATIGEYDEQSFSGQVKVKLGPIALLYTGSGTFVEKDDAAHRFVVDAKGKDKRGNGTAGAKVTLSMTDAGGATDVEVLTDLAITGKPAQFGRGVMQDVSDKLLGQFVSCLEQRLGEGAPPGDEAPPDPPAVPVSPAATSAPAAADPGAPSSAAADAPAPAPVPATPRPAPAADDDALDLGATVIPVLLRSYGPQAAVVLVVAVLAYLLGRRRA